MKNLAYSFGFVLALASFTNTSFAAGCLEPGAGSEDEDELVDVDQGSTDDRPVLSEPRGCPLPKPDPKPIQPAAPKCATLFADANFGGVSFAMPAGSKVTDFNAHLYQRRKWHGSLQGYSGSDKSFNDIFSSVVVEPRCTLQVWDASDFNGESRSHGGTETEARSIILINLGFDDITSSAACTCGSIPPGTPAPIRSNYFEIPSQ